MTLFCKRLQAYNRQRPQVTRGPARVPQQGRSPASARPPNGRNTQPQSQHPSVPEVALPPDRLRGVMSRWPPVFTALFRACLLSWIVLAPSSALANAITDENALPGSPSSEWDVSLAGDATIQGFATDISVDRGQTIHFKVDTDAPAWHVEIYRLGYYQGNGARHVGSG